FCFVSYYNMVNVGQSWIASSRVSMPGFMLALHGGAFLMACAWLAQRHWNLTWRNALPQITAPSRELGA
ncbi:MAG: hypothetical protein EBQ86_14145, partial [Betaproteobacteria bacterium]|nr:hypothetical protein [Betaproteobacteria bacterium]